MLRKILFMTCILIMSVVPVVAQDGLGPLAEALAAADPTYDVLTEVVSFPSGGDTLVGTLVRPDGDGPFPGVIVMHGFTVARHDVPVPGTDEDVYQRLGRVFAERGYVSLAFDFYGAGESDGEFADVTFTRHTADAVAALDYLESLDFVDADNLIVQGWSHGGAIAALVAGQDERVSNALLFAAPSNLFVTYSALIPLETVLSGVRSEGELIDVNSSLGEFYQLRKPFFDEMFTVDPVAAIQNYGGPLFVAAGANDDLVFPQPQAGQVYLDYHSGPETFYFLEDSGHVFSLFEEGNNGTTYDALLFNALAWLETSR